MPSRLGHHLLPLLAVCFMAGIGCSSLLIAPLITLCLIITVLLLLLAWCCWRALPAIGQIASLLLLFHLGLLSGLVSSSEPADAGHIYHRITERQDVVAVGRLLAMPSYDGTFSRARIELYSVRLSPATTHVATSGTIVLRLSAPWPKAYRPGTLLAIRAELQRPRPATVPGAFDYAAELARRDIWITASCRSVAQIQTVAETASMLRDFRYMAERVRSDIGYFLDTNLPQPTSGIYRAILLGDRSRIAPELIEGFKTSGTMHILAISGMHLTLVGGLLYGILYWLLRRSQRLILRTSPKKLAMILVLPLLWCYTLLAGANTPVIRAFLMAFALLVALLSDRPKSADSLVSAAALLILAASPQALFTASFQLSFAAFSAIALMMPAMQKIISHATVKHGKQELTCAGRFASWAKCALYVSLVAVLATAPITLHHFHRLSPIGPLANLMIEPLICLWALPWGMLALPTMAVSPALATRLLELGSFGIDLALLANGLIQQLPGNSLWRAAPGVTMIVGYYTLLLCGLSGMLQPLAGWRLLLRLAPFMVMATWFFSPMRPDLPKSEPLATVYVIDVGQGSATLINFADNRHVLIDAGGPAYDDETVGQRTIAPLLWHLGISQLETIVLTHPDSDHTNGALFLLQQFKPRMLITNTLNEDNPSFAALLKAARQQGVEVVEAHAGQVLRSGQESLVCLANTSDYSRTSQDGNEGLVLQLRLPEITMLFPGDIEAAAEQRLLASGTALASDILLAAHHGSATSNTEPLMAGVSPQLVIVSSGKNKNGYYPSPQLTALCDRSNIPLLTTAEVGTIALRSNAGSYLIEIMGDSQGNPLRRPDQYWQTAQRISVK